MNVIARILEHTLVYRLWQAPFAERKLAPVLAHNDLGGVRRVLDVGCGPGTNTHHFAHADYLGIDINSGYIAHAQRRHGKRFLAADITTHSMPADERFDFILVNSFLHHLDTKSVSRVLTRLSRLLTDDGHLHVLELVLPEHASVARVLARYDRGRYARSLEEWREILAGIFDPVLFEPYRVTGLETTLWNMLYFKGRAKR